MFCVEKTGVRVFRDSAGDSPVAKPQSRVHPEAFGDSLATHLGLAKIFATEPRDSPSRERPEIAFYGKPVLNLFHPLLNPFFTIFTSKPNQFEWFFISSTSLR